MLFIVGFGAGGEKGMTLEARQALEKSDVIAGYTVYAQLLKSIFPHKEYFVTPMRKEKERCIWAIETAKQNKTYLFLSARLSIRIGKFSFGVGIG